MSTGINKWKFYLVYWALYFLFAGIMQAGVEQDYYHSFLAELISMPVKIFFVAMAIEWLMARYFFAGKFREFAVGYSLLIVGFAIMLRLTDNYLILPFVLTHWPRAPILSPVSLFLNIVKLQFVVSVPFLISFYANWLNERNRLHQVEMERKQAELNFLRDQFHPHLLFNSLNSLYSKILMNSPQSAAITLHISSLLRYSLYETNAGMISLGKEITYLTDYIALQKVRFDDRLDLSFSFGGDTENKFIEPFLITPFVENSFKFCMDDESESGWITVDGYAAGDWLTVKIENSNPYFKKDKPQRPLTECGVGLQNVRRRLELLYPGEHILKTQDEDNRYFVSLKVKLRNNES